MFGRKPKEWQKLYDEPKKELKTDPSHPQKTSAKPKQSTTKKKHQLAYTTLFPRDKYGKSKEEAEIERKNKPNGMVPRYFGPGVRP